MATCQKLRVTTVHKSPRRKMKMAPIHLRLPTPPNDQIESPARQAPRASPDPFSDDFGRMNILVAPSGFKESLDAEEVADCIESGIRRVLPKAQIRKVALHDGGEGFSKALVKATGGELYPMKVTGPVGKEVDSHIGLISSTQKTAVLDMAAAAGLRLVPKDCRDPTLTTTYGVGQLISKALDLGCDKIIVGCGDSGTSDGGAGMLQALGMRLLDHNGDGLPLACGGKDLVRLASIDTSNAHPRLAHVEIEAVCNWKNLLCGQLGVARVYGPQKGATPDQVELLSAALENYGSIISQLLGEDITLAPGSGASGGLGAGLMLIKATPRTRYEAAMEYFGIEDLFEKAQLLFTAEGGLDFQTPRGKITAEVARRARSKGLRVIALAGTIGTGANSCYEAGIDAFSSILKEPTSLEKAIQNTERLLTDGAESTMRMIMIGSSLRPCRSDEHLSPVENKIKAPRPRSVGRGNMVTAFGT